MVLNVHEAKTHLSRHLETVEAGGVIVLCRRNEPIAEIRSIAKNNKPRQIGVAQGEFTVPDSFFDPLPDDMLAAFNGE